MSDFEKWVCEKFGKRWLDTNHEIARSAYEAGKAEGFDLGRKAGLIAVIGEQMQCPKCKKETEHIHIIDRGPSGAYMSGTEHYECVECGTDLYKTDGEKQGLEFVLD